MNIGHVLVPTRDQNLELQLDALQKAKCETISECRHGKNSGLLLICGGVTA